jgi:hypothetical protein
MKRLFVFAGAMFVATMLSACGANARPLEVGDCFNEPEGGQATRVELISCQEPHDTEVFGRFVLPHGEYPGPESVAESAAEGCYTRMEHYVGENLLTSGLAIVWLAPTEERWDDEERTVICALRDGAGAQLDRSQLNAGR